jgi:hypothetical protein
MLTALGGAPAVAWGDGGDEQANGKPTSVTPAKGCPGDVVTFQGTGFETDGSRNRVRWNDFKAGEEQFGSPIDVLFKQQTQALATTSATEQKAVVPLMLQLWEGTTGAMKDGRWQRDLRRKNVCLHLHQPVQVLRHRRECWPRPHRPDRTCRRKRNQRNERR